jgi:hypothetical protein
MEFFQLTSGGAKVELGFENAVVVRGAYDDGNFLRLGVAHSRGDRNSLEAVYRYIERLCSPSFSPLKYAVENGSWDDIVCKISRTAAWNPFERRLGKGELVDVTPSPGAFGPWGWCLNVTRIEWRKD